MDRLLVVTPREVRFHLEVGKKAVAKIRLQNLMHTMPVAFKVFTTASHKYTVNSQSVIIPPLGEHILEVTMAAQSSLPEHLPYSLDKVHVKSLMIPTGKASLAQLDKWFGTRKKHVFSDATLKIVFTGNHVLWSLAVSGSMEGVKEVLRDTLPDVRDRKGRTALHIAAVEGNLGALHALLASKCNVNERDTLGQIPLFEAVLGGHRDIVKALLDAGAETEHRNACGWTCLHAAAAWNRPDIVKLLVDAGADVDAVDERGRTPLHEAASAGNSKVLWRLLQLGADIGKRCRDGCTPLHVATAAGYEEAVEVLLKEGADISVSNREMKTPRDLAHEIGRPILLDYVHLQVMLERAARKNDVKAVEECLLSGAKIDAADQNGWTALHRAAFKGNMEVVTLLLEHCFDINMKDEEGYTPLHCAIEAGHREVVEILLQHRAGTSMKVSKGGLTALGLAFMTKHPAIQHLVEDSKFSFVSCK